MKKNILLASWLLTSLLTFVGSLASAQSLIINNDFNNLYLNKSNFEDLRVHNNSNVGIVVMAPINIGLPKVISENVYPADPEDINRLPDALFPGLRFFKGNRTMTYSLIYAKKSYKFEGTGDSASGSTYSEYVDRVRKTRIAVRFANDFHFKPNRFKWFDLDHYMGFAVNAGIAPTKSINDSVFRASSDFRRETVTENPLTFGGDVYWGANLKFEYWSIGAEFLIFGMDIQKNVGRKKVEQSSKIGSTSTSSTYYTAELPNGTGSQQFNDLSISSSQVSLFRGFRIVGVIYLKRPSKG